MSRKLVALSFLSGCLILGTSLANATVFSGSLSSVGGEIGGVGNWISSGPATLTWQVTDLGTHYHYEYALTVPRFEISHFIVEVSQVADSGDFWNFSGPFSLDPEIGNYSQANGNPNIPAPLHGLKFDETYGTTAVFAFDSVRVPVWGDFYAKGGGNPTNQVWNAGLTLPDPAAPAASGSIDNHILVPDSQVVPEPVTVVLLLLGTVLLAGRKRR